MSLGGTRSVGLSLGLLSAVSFGTSGPVGKSLIDSGFSPLQAVWVRICGAAVVLLALVVVLRGRAALGSVRRHWAPVLAYALVAIAMCQALYFIAASRLPVGVAILLEFTGPVLVVGWLGLVRRQVVSRNAYVGVLIALCGLACVVQIWSGVRLDAVGVAAGLGAACGNAGYFLIIDRLAGSVDALVLTSGGMGVAALALVPLAAPWRAPWHLLAHSVPVGSHQSPGWLLAGALVLVSTVVAYLAGAGAVMRLSAPVAAGVAYIEAVAASLVAWAALGERLTPVQLTGGVIVLVGAFTAQRAVDARGQTEASYSGEPEVIDGSRERPAQSEGTEAITPSAPPLYAGNGS
ncbi:MAG: EamA family transporter [Trebonia sp.]